MRIPARWARLGVQLVLAFLTGLASFAVVAVVVAAAEPIVLVVIIGVACLVGVFAIARLWGIAYAVPAAMAGLLAFDWYEFPPTHPHEFPDATSLINLLVYVAVSAVIGELAANAVRARGELLDEQAALTRVATLVARGVPPADVFAAVAREMGELVGADATHMGRYEPDGTVTGVASWSRTGAHLPTGTRAAVSDGNVTALVRETGRPARVDSYAGASDDVAELLRSVGIRTSVGAPIVVGGQLWGVMIASSKSDRRLPAGTEERIGQFADLVATAIANAQARTELAASRARVVAAGDQERQRVVRDLHDGAQQRLVHTVVTLKLAQRSLEQGDDVQDQLAEALDQAERAQHELRELAHGILPAVLTHGGLPAAVDALASRMPIPVDIDVPVPRLDPRVEATAYYVAAEALTNVAKHARADSVTVSARVDDEALELRVHDDGVGGAKADGSGLVGLADRLAVLDGRLRVESPPDGGTLVVAAIPVTEP